MSLVLTTEKGRVLFFNGRNSYSQLGVTTLDDALASFDRYAEWVAAGNGGPNDDASPKMRGLLVEAYHEALAVAVSMPAPGVNSVPMFIERGS